jgi:hypothetical protein
LLKGGWHLAFQSRHATLHLLNHGSLLLDRRGLLLDDGFNGCVISAFASAGDEVIVGSCDSKEYKTDT